MASRGGFSSSIGFVLAAAGSAVGLGNIWKFPFEATKGGGAAFVIIYLFFCFIFCYPVLVAEISIGRATRKNPVGAFVALSSKKWGIIGVLGVFGSVIVLSFYNVVAGWSLGYFVEMVEGNFEIGNNFSKFVNNIPVVSLYSIAFMFITSYIVFKGIKNGIELASKILMPSLVIIILFLIGYGFTLPHAFEGIRIYLIPDFSKINFYVIYSALGHAFFSLSLGMGTLITYGSYLRKNANIPKAAALITLSDIFIAFIAGLMMFSLLGFVYKGDLTDVEGGPGLIFQTLPLVFQTLSGTGQIIGIVFFILLSFAALTSTVSLLETPVAYLIDEYKFPRKKAVIIVSIIVLILGIPSILANGASPFFSNFIQNSEGSISFMDFIAGTVVNILLPLGGLLIAIFTVFIWKNIRFLRAIKFSSNERANNFMLMYLTITLKYICIPILLIIITMTVLEQFFNIDINSLIFWIRNTI